MLWSCLYVKVVGWCVYIIWVYLVSCKLIFFFIFLLWLSECKGGSCIFDFNLFFIIYLVVCCFILRLIVEDCIVFCFL